MLIVFNCWLQRFMASDIQPEDWYNQSIRAGLLQQGCRTVSQLPAHCLQVHFRSAGRHPHTGEEQISRHQRKLKIKIIVSYLLFIYWKLIHLVVFLFYVFVFYVSVFSVFVFFVFVFFVILLFCVLCFVCFIVAYNFISEVSYVFKWISFEIMNQFYKIQN